MAISPSPPALADWSARRIILATLVVVAVALGFWLLYQIRLVVIILFTAIIIGVALKPLTDKLSDGGISPLIGVILIYGVLFISLAGLFILITPLLVKQLTAITASLPDYYQSFRNALTQSPNLFLQQISWQLPLNFELSNLTTGLNSPEIDPVTQALAMTGLVLKSLFITIATFILSLYWTLDSERTKRNLLLLIPTPYRDESRILFEEMEAKVGAYVRGQAILCLVIGGLSLVAYLVIGVPYAFALALFAGLMEAVPYVGPILGAIPALALAASVSQQQLLWVVVATLIIQQIENTFLVPRVMSQAVGVNSFVSLLALFAFGTLGGILGVLLAIPVAAILQLLLNRFLLKRSILEQQSEIGRNELSRLRYYVQDLIEDMRKQIRHDELVPDEDNEKMVEEDIEAIASDLDSILAQAEASARG
ncbi:MAG: AI-2E family transporter [Anaerolineaceae bacterium]|nr:AI-2E family transporter [Anaerolineaceae bacterium]MCB9101892.1 AI-2E family transporter [Anaerolineales bacterium]